MAKKQRKTVKVEATITVEITRGCIYAEGTTHVLDTYTANHLINMGYAKKVSSGEFGQTNHDSPAH